MNILNAIYSFIGTVTLLFQGLLLPNEVSFTSKESKTIEHKEVLNKVTLKRFPSKDIWIMQQYHSGHNNKEWDTIEIIINKEKSPYSVLYLQKDGDKKIPLKADCFRCHVNGPRIIRPKYNLSIKEKAIVFAYNSIMKSYGKVAQPQYKNKGTKLKALNACLDCHNGMIRSILKKEHSDTITFLVQNNYMPPWPHQISKKEKKEILHYINSFQ